MNDDVTIPRETAKEWAEFIRNNAGGGRLAGLDDLADLLDSPQPSLREEVARIIGETCGGVSMCWEPKPIIAEFDSAAAAKFVDEAVYDVLAVVRKHIAAMRGWDGGVASMDWSPDGPWIDRGDVLALLGGES